MNLDLDSGSSENGEARLKVEDELDTFGRPGFRGSLPVQTAGSLHAALSFRLMAVSTIPAQRRGR